ncbi:MAG: radical SAM protein [Dehalococcoidia bacterium]|nr:MAG: radical SAM protein [Dehalococcoidia bacterium]
MKVLLVNPPGPPKGHYFVTPPLGLMYLASSLRLSGHHVKILDLFSFGEGAEKLSEVLAREFFDMVGITGMSLQHNEILKASEIIKAVDKKIVVAVGGSHASALPSLLLRDENIDFVFRGESDYAFPSLADAISNGTKWENILGLCFKTDREFHISPPAIIENIDSLPFPAWDLIEIKKYVGFHHGFFYEREPIGKIISSRGCPYLCTFCAAQITHSRTWRPHSPERVISEIDRLVREVGIQELHIEDDNFTLNLKRAKDIFREIINRKYDLKINFPNGLRMDRLDDQLLKLMKQAGVYSITFGIESGSPQILRMIKKNISCEFIEKQVKKVKKYGFYTQGFFIIGFPFERKKDIEKTINFALKLDLDAAFFGTYVPLPGSEDFERLITTEKISLENMDWDHMFSTKAQDSSLYLTSQEIQYLQRIATRKFYIRPRILLRALLRIRGLSQIKGLLTRIW